MAAECFHEIGNSQIVDKKGVIGFRLAKMNIAPRSEETFEAEFNASIAWIEAQYGADFFKSGVCITEAPNHLWVLPHGPECGHEGGNG